MVNRKVCVVACGVIMFICAMFFGLAWRNSREIDECILTQPSEAVSGFITYPGTMYFVSYSGTKKVSGESCVLNVLVTLSEYERMMYGRQLHD